MTRSWVDTVEPSSCCGSAGACISTEKHWDPALGPRKRTKQALTTWRVKSVSVGGSADCFFAISLNALRRCTALFGTGRSSMTRRRRDLKGEGERKPATARAKSLASTQQRCASPGLPDPCTQSFPCWLHHLSGKRLPVLYSRAERCISAGFLTPSRHRAACLGTE
jgi:hypothetical protein